MKIDKAFMSIRIGVAQWMSEVRFSGLMELLNSHTTIADEVSFFTSETHAPLTLEETFRRCDILKKRMAVAREAGFRSGINILGTIGHHEENLANSFFGDFYRMTDIDGKVCMGSFCPNDQRYLTEYVKPVYEALTNAVPDYIWIDDDVRLSGHMPISQVCFCDNCMEIFTRDFGKKYTRDALRKEFDSGSIEDMLQIRRKWLSHNRNTIANLLRFIERTVHGINPAIHLGFMCCPLFFEGFDMDGWAKVLAGPDDVDVYWRPGGGYYDEKSLDDFVTKAHGMGWAAAVLPEKIRSIQSEIECFPYERLAKSTQAVAFEAAVYIATGCTGAAYNILSMTDEPLDDYYPLAKKLCTARPFLDTMAKELGRTPSAGIFPGWSKDSYAAKNIDGGDWLYGKTPIPGLCNADEIYHLGLPVSYDSQSAAVYALSDELVEVLDDETIRKYLSRGVYMDAKALARLNRRGYGEYTGFEIAEKKTIDTLERLTPHPLNGEYEGRYRDCRQSFWWSEPAYGLVPHQDAQRLSNLINYRYDVVCDCGSGVFENSLGGRVCVAGYFPWFKLQFGYKAAQLKNIMRWLSHDTLGTYVKSYHRISVWDRIRPDGSHAVALANCYLDAAENVELMLHTSGDKIKFVDMENIEIKVTAKYRDGKYACLVLPQMKPWQVYLAVEN